MGYPSDGNAQTEHRGEASCRHASSTIATYLPRLTSAMEQETVPTQIETRPFRRLAGTIVATIFLGAVGSGIWELMFRPGLSTAGALLASISTRFESEVYSTAALDPTPVPGLILLLMVCSLPFLAAIMLLMVAFVDPVIVRMVAKSKKKMLEGATTKEHRFRLLSRRRKAVALIAATMLFGFGAISYVGYTLENEATIVWRTFNANFEVVAAHQTEPENKGLRAQFRQMKNKADFERLQTQMNQAAQRNGASLEWYGI